MSWLTLLVAVFGLVLLMLLGMIVVWQMACAKHPLIVMALSLCGIVCLVLGVVLVFGLTRHRHHVVRHGWVAETGDAGGRPAKVLRLDVTGNGELEYPVSSSADAGSGVDAKASPPVEETGTDVRASAKRPSDEMNAEGEETPEQGGQPAGEGTLEMRNRVEIDFDARPEWVDQPDRDVGEIHQISLSSGPFLRLRDARKELYKQLKLATDEYINEFIGHPHAARWVRYDEEAIRRRFVGPEHLFDEKVVSPSFGPMQQSHGLLEFGPGFHREVEQAWHHVRARAQLGKVALGGGAVLGVLLLLFGYFSVDTATRGFYSGRLKFVTILAILTLVVTGFAIARSIPWLWL